MYDYELTSAQVYSMWGAAGVAVLLVIWAGTWAFIASCRAHARFVAHINRLLTLPAESVAVWVAMEMVSDDYGEHPEYTLYSRVDGEEATVISEDDRYMIAVCRIFRKAGRPVKGIPSQWYPAVQKPTP